MAQGLGQVLIRLTEILIGNATFLILFPEHVFCKLVLALHSDEGQTLKMSAF